MDWFKKKPDPISDRARALSDEIAHLEVEIKRLDTQLKKGESHPRLRSTAVPHGETVSHNKPSTAPPGSASHEPIFEDVGKNRLAPQASETTPELYNELGVRKYDLPAVWRRIRNHFRGPSASNPKLVSYLAAGGIQGLRPLRYEKRVARNRFLFFVIGLFLVLLGLLWVLRGKR